MTDTEGKLARALDIARCLIDTQHPDDHPEWTVPMARALIAQTERVRELERLLQWCRPRLKSAAYQEQLDRQIASPVRPDHTKVVASKEG